MATFRSLSLLAALLQVSTAQFLTAAPMLELHRRQASGCSSFLNIESSCALATNDFTDLPFTSQVDCLCDGTGFDNAFAGCLGYLSTQTPALYSSLESLGLPSSPCAALGGGSGSGPTTTASTFALTTSRATATTRTSSGASITSAATNTNDPNYQACVELVSSDDACSSATNNFGSLSATAQASCLCYIGSSYAPENYDTIRESCLSYFATDDPPRYQSIVRNGGATTSLCSSIGDVRGNGGAVATSTTSARPGSTTSARTTTSTSRTTSSPATTTSTSSPGVAAPTGVAGGASFMAAIGVLALAVVL